jgi:hypothetical protein
MGGSARRFFKMLKEKLKRGYRLREGSQVPTRLTTVEEIMADPYFALGAADVRAGRGYRAGYDTWGHTNNRWAYDRGRLWATLAPKHVRLKRNGRISSEALRCTSSIATISRDPTLERIDQK